MPESLRMRPFRSVGDVLRMLQRLFGSKAKARETLSTGEMLAFLQRIDPIPGAFAAYQTIINTAAAQTWDWWTFPADTILQDPGGASVIHGGFWNPGQAILPPKGTIAVRTFLTGWYFEPTSLTFRYYTSADNAKNGTTDIIRTFGAYLAARTPGVITPADTFILARRLVTTLSQIQTFGLCPEQGTATAGTMHVLIPTAIIPGQRIQFSGFTGLVNGDKVALNMRGNWRFNPRFIEASEERDG